MNKKIRIAIFVSGSGSNAENLYHYFKENKNIEVISFYCNNPKAYAIERAKKLGVNCHLFSKNDFTENGRVLQILKEEKIDFIVLAGFLWLIPKVLIEAYPSRIVNIHPALLPDFGGKGMYGMKVHEAVKMQGKKQTGISIHFVNENYDEGNIIFQAKTEILETDTIDDIASKVHALEYQYFPSIVESTILNIFKVKI